MGWDLVLLYLSQIQISAVQAFSDKDLANQVLADFVDFAKTCGWRIWRVRYAILSVQHNYKSLKRHLPRPWEALQSWQLTLPVKTRLPIDKGIVKAMFIVAVSKALEHPEWAGLLISFAVLMRVGFKCLLRPGEITKLTSSNVSLPAPWHDMRAVISILDAKNRAHLGRVQFVLLSSRKSILWLQWLLDTWPTETKLWLSSPQRFRSLFRYVLSQLELSRFPLGPGSLRPGRATHLFCKHASVPRLKYEGRWLSEKSLGSYIQEALGVSTHLQLSSCEQSRIATILAQGAPIWQSPPKCQFSTLLVNGQFGRKDFSGKGSL